MKLAICSVGELFGGVERHILGMSTWLKREGHEFVLILFHDRELARQAREIGVEPVILEGRGAIDLGVVRRLGDLLAEHEVDVVHAHGYKAVVNCALARRRHRFAMVRTVHGLVESAGWWSWKGFKGRVYSRLERYFGRRAGAAVAYVTDDLRQRHQHFDRGLMTRTIHNGIDPLDRNSFPRPVDLPPGTFNLAAVGRVTRIKGLDSAIRAVAGLDPSLSLVLNIIGTGPLVEELKKLVENSGSGRRVRFLGFKKNVYDYLANVDLLVMPSIHEGLPYTILEAMSLGVAIVASEVGGLAEVLEDGVTGSLVAPGDVSGLGSSLEKLVRNPGLAEKFGNRGRIQLEENLNLEKFGSRYFEYYSHCLQESSVLK